MHVLHVIPDSLHLRTTQVAQPLVQNHVQPRAQNHRVQMEHVHTVQTITRVRKIRHSLRVPLRHYHAPRQQSVVTQIII